MRCKMCTVELLANWSAGMCSECIVTYAKEFKGSIFFSLTKDARIRCGYCKLNEPTFANFCSLGKHYFRYHLRAVSDKIDNKELEKASVK
jgi:hypothetical protein